MNIPFVKVSPGGNTTILLGMPAPDASSRAGIATVLMDPLHLGAEQVGFMDTSSAIPRLDMMGGEFCGNAARSFATWLVMENHPALMYCAKTAAYEGEIAVSGAPDLVRVRVAIREEEAFPLTGNGNAVMLYDASVRLGVPQHADMCIERVCPGMDIVRLAGITHVMLDTHLHAMPSEYISQACALRVRLGLQKEDAVGCIWYSRRPGCVRIDPVVWVRETESVHYETGCGSGTLALGLLEAIRSGAAWEGSVLQPSGQSIQSSICFSDGSGFSEAWIGGTVRVIARGEVFL